MEVYISELFLNKATSFPKELSANVGQTKGNGAFVGDHLQLQSGCSGLHRPNQQGSSAHCWFLSFHGIY